MYKYEDFEEWLKTQEATDIIENIKYNIDENKSMNFYDLTKEIYGDSWEMLACIDYLEKTGYLECINRLGTAQDYRYISCKNKTKELILDNIDSCVGDIRFCDFYRGILNDKIDIVLFYIKYLEETGYIKCITGKELSIQYRVYIKL